MDPLLCLLVLLLSFFFLFLFFFFVIKRAVTFTAWKRISPSEHGSLINFDKREKKSKATNASIVFVGCSNEIIITRYQLAYLNLLFPLHVLSLVGTKIADVLLTVT